MKDTSSIGSTTEGMILAALLRKGKKVLLPFGSAARYDILLDENGMFVRVQCKTAQLQSNGSIKFRNYSVGRDGKSKPYSKEEIDAYGVFCPGNGKVYVIPIEDCNRITTRFDKSEAMKFEF